MYFKWKIHHIVPENEWCVFEGSHPANEYQYLARSEEMEGSSDFVALGESSESKTVSGIKKLDFDLQKRTMTSREVGMLCQSLHWFDFKLTDNVWTLRRQGVQGRRRKWPAKTHLLKKVIFWYSSYCLLAHLIEDVAKAVHVQWCNTVDGFQAKSLGSMTWLNTKKEASGSAENCAAVPGERHCTFPRAGSHYIP